MVVVSENEQLPDRGKKLDSSSLELSSVVPSVPLAAAKPK